MIFASPVSADYLDGSFYEDAGRPFYLSPDKLAGDYAPVRFDRELRLFRRYSKGGKVLDVGCSTGAFLFQLGQRFPKDYEVYGTDVSGPALDHAESQGVRTLRKDFLASDFPETGFDAITLWAVLEHVSEPRKFLEQAARLLKPGGICFVLVPHWNSLARRLLKNRYRYILGQHLNYFTPATLRRLAEPKFEVMATTFTHFNPLVIIQDFTASRERSGAERVELLRKTNRMKEQRGSLLKLAYRALEKGLARMRLTDNLALVLRKPHIEEH
ncbi:MAG: class I SAM-dependent methyltransferase [Limisphaerales bacterium]